MPSWGLAKQDCMRRRLRMEMGCLPREEQVEPALLRRVADGMAMALCPAESMAQQFSVQAIQQMAKIQDLRGKYF